MCVKYTTIFKKEGGREVGVAAKEHGKGPLGDGNALCHDHVIEHQPLSCHIVLLSYKVLVTAGEAR